MDSTQTIHKTPTVKNKVHSSELKKILTHYTDQTKILSLDCFDTILWRKTATPVDVFYELQKKPTFAALGFSASLRIQYEAHARNMKFIQEKKTEIILEDIYRAAFPHLDSSQLSRLAEEELETEMQACYAYPPMLELMQEAVNHHKKIIIVSDTYFTENQLMRLLGYCLPIEIMQIINHIFCSCEYGKSKSNGLFRIVLDKLSQTPDSVLHIGDNHQADVLGAQAAQIPSLEFIHHEQNLTDKYRLQFAAGSLFHSDFRHSHALPNPFRGVLSNHVIDKPEQMIGFASIGPVMYAFAKFLLNEIEILKKSCKNLKIVFLMRDAYLPSLICETLARRPIGKRVRISRFTSFAASFCTKEDVEKYLSTVIFTQRYKEIATQLLLPEEVITPLVEATLQSNSPIMQFLELVLRSDILNIIFIKSKEIRQRLFKYLKKETGLKRGDTLMFIDLGYSGTAQRQLQNVFKQELDVDIIGRYLIELNIPDWQKSRRGLLDPSWCDDRAMLALVNHIALLEQICTSNEKSVIDYDRQGNPIYSKTSLEKSQYHKLESIQKECVLFAKAAEQFFKKTGYPTHEILRQIALMELARFIFLPGESEVQYLESFQFDINLGTNDILRVFDSHAGLKSLKKRGLFFSFMERNNKTMRTNYPAELRYAGLELVMTVMAQYRFGFDIGYKDISLRREKIHAHVLQVDGIHPVTFEALLTYDGYYALQIPVNPEFAIELNFGQHYQWLEIDDAELINLSTFLLNTDSLYAEDFSTMLVFKEMQHHGGKLFSCVSTSGRVQIPPFKKSEGQHYLVRIIFRPVVKQGCIA